MAVTTAHEDLAGLSPVYYNPRALERGFATVPEKLASDPQVDKVTLAASMLWSGISPLVESYSYFEGVRRLRAGEIATIEGGELYIHDAYPTESAGATFDGVAEQLGESLHHAVNEVIAQSSGSLSADFSGGLDSTPLGLAAAAQCPPGANILGLVQYNPDYPAGDIKYAREFAELNNRLRLQELVTSDNELPFTRMSLQGISPSEPYRGVVLFNREAQRLAAARTHHMTGVGGDGLFDPELAPILVALLLDGEHDLAKQVILHAVRATHEDPKAVLDYIEHLQTQNLPLSLERVARQLTSNDLLQQPDDDWLPPIDEAAKWLTPEMREAVAARALETAKRAPNMGFSDYTTRQAITDSGDAHRHMQMLAEQFGVTLFAPYLGEAVLRPVLALPATMRIQPGQFKPLLRAASKAVGLAPDELFAVRKGKGTYSAEMNVGFSKALPDIKDMLQRSRLAQLGIIDPEAVMTSLSLIKPPLPSLTRLVACEDWLAYLGVEVSEVRGITYQNTVEKLAATPENTLPKGNFAFVPSLHIVTEPGGQIAAFDPERGVFLPPIGRSKTTRLILESLFKGNSPQNTVAFMQQKYPKVPIDRLTADVASTIRGLAEHGWLQPVGEMVVQPIPLPRSSALPAPPVEAGELLRVRASTLSIEEVTEMERDAVERAYASVRQLMAEGVPFTELTRHITEANSRTTQPASQAEALRALELARLITMDDDQHRVACYELSLTAALYCMANGLSVDWCLGISFDMDDPGYHAWIEAKGKPVHSEADEMIEGIHRRLLRVSDKVDY